jgi:hypothetical protein
MHTQLKQTGHAKTMEMLVAAYLTGNQFMFMFVAEHGTETEEGVFHYISSSFKVLNDG